MTERRPDNKMAVAAAGRIHIDCVSIDTGTVGMGAYICPRCDNTHIRMVNFDGDVRFELSMTPDEAMRFATLLNNPELLPRDAT